VRPDGQPHEQTERGAPPAPHPRESGRALIVPDGDRQSRIDDLIRRWRVTVDHTLETETSWLAFGTRADHPVVLKVINSEGDEWRCGAVLEAFGGRGVVEVYEHVEGAALLERAMPGQTLAAARAHNDDEATAMLSGVIEQMSGCTPPAHCRAVLDWATAFDRYLASGDGRIPPALVEHAARHYRDLAGSQRGIRLLHGDLHHDNVLLDARRGWLAIDPKGVAGEVEFEIGAAMRNPYDKPELFTSPTAVERRLRQYVDRLDLDRDRAIRWTYAQAVLSALWEIEDGRAVDAGSPVMKLAATVRALLG
jgi:streptomycin 6-kinase